MAKVKKMTPEQVVALDLELCNLCQIPKGVCRGPLHKHIMDRRVYLKATTKELATLQEKIDALGDAEPMIGLEFIIQYAPDVKGVLTYHCELCNVFFKINQSFSHITGSSHRLMYLKTKGFEEKTLHFKTVQQYEEFVRRCKFAEKFWGSNKIKVVEELAPIPANAQAKDGQSPTFLELKSAHEAKLKAAQDSGGKIKVEVPKCDVDSFSCNEELFEFLGTFSVESERDVPFVMKVSQAFAKALVQHKRLQALKLLVSANRKKMQEEKKASTNQPKDGRRPMTDSQRAHMANRKAHLAIKQKDSTGVLVDVRGPGFKYKKQIGYGKYNPGAAARAQPGKQGPDYKNKMQSGTKNPEAAAGDQKGEQGAADQPKKPTDYGTENPAVIRMLQQLEAVKAMHIQRGPAFNLRGSGAQNPRGRGSHQNQGNPGRPFMSQKSFYGPGAGNKRKGPPGYQPGAQRPSKFPARGAFFPSRGRGADRRGLPAGSAH
ncbi:uncharacterized protein LOC134980361 [Pseudophryne corroboree]|uniref:uncharacterized protein LOC134980361 n=1 Tax=Pseudophryne corroboree TaxID=495146 RepID=UPI0030818E77